MTGYNAYGRQSSSVQMGGGMIGFAEASGSDGAYAVNPYGRHVRQVFTYPIEQLPESVQAMFRKLDLYLSYLRRKS